MAFVDGQFAGIPGTACAPVATKVVRVVVRVEIDACPPQWEVSGGETWHISPVRVTFDQSLAKSQCLQQLQAILLGQAVYAYENYKDSLLTELLQMDNCMQMQEAFSVSYENREQHYTLYYYDLAGNLVQTIPPKGVKPLTAIHFNAPNATMGQWDGTHPSHDARHFTTYKYNTLGQVLEQSTPDGGKTGLVV